VRDRPAALVSLYASIETFAKSFGQVEFVTRDRYVLMRSDRIFADLVVMSDALRLAIHLPRKARHPLFIKVAADRKHVTHVAKIRSREEFETLKPLLRDAYEFSIA
jgi:predicted transport protein